VKLPRPRHSTVVAYLALFVALGGTSYAAIKLPANSVGSREIKQRSVQTSDLALNARLTKNNKVFRSAVTDVVLDPNTQAVVDALKGAVKGEKGDAGTTGPAGPAGAQGAAGVSGYIIREAYSRVVNGGEEAAGGARCEPGERVISGGGLFEAQGTSSATLVFSYPEHSPTTGDAWLVTYSNGGGGANPGRVHAFAVCASVS